MSKIGSHKVHRIQDRASESIVKGISGVSAVQEVMSAPTFHVQNILKHFFRIPGVIFGPWVSVTDLCSETDEKHESSVLVHIWAAEILPPTFDICAENLTQLNRTGWLWHLGKNNTCLRFSTLLLSCTTFTTKRLVVAMLVKPTLTDIYEQKCQKLCATQQKVAYCDWIPAAKVTLPSSKVELKTHSQKTWILQLNTHLLLKELYSTVFVNVEGKKSLM